MRLLTLGEAIEETESMWRNIIDTGRKPNTVWLHDCPCCEYVYQKKFGKTSERFCIMAQSEEDYKFKKAALVHDDEVILCINNCPMRELWPDGCESPSSPYRKWSNNINFDKDDHAEEIADFAKDLKEDTP